MSSPFPSLYKYGWISRRAISWTPTVPFFRYSSISLPPRLRSANLYIGLHSISLFCSCHAESLSSASLRFRILPMIPNFKKITKSSTRISSSPLSTILNYLLFSKQSKPIYISNFIWIQNVYFITYLKVFPLVQFTFKIWMNKVKNSAHNSIFPFIGL